MVSRLVPFYLSLSLSLSLCPPVATGVCAQAAAGEGRWPCHGHASLVLTVLPCWHGLGEAAACRGRGYSGRCQRCIHRSHRVPHRSLAVFPQRAIVADAAPASDKATTISAVSTPAVSPPAGAATAAPPMSPRNAAVAGSGVTHATAATPGAPLTGLRPRMRAAGGSSAGGGGSGSEGSGTLDNGRPDGHGLVSSACDWMDW